MYAPKCTPEQLGPQLPSKGLCESARNDCEPILKSFGFSWPPALACETLPVEEVEPTQVPTQQAGKVLLILLV